MAIINKYVLNVLSPSNLNTIPNAKAKRGIKMKYVKAKKLCTELLISMVAITIKDIEDITAPNLIPIINSFLIPLLKFTLCCTYKLTKDKVIMQIANGYLVDLFMPKLLIALSVIEKSLYSFRHHIIIEINSI